MRTRETKKKNWIHFKLAKEFKETFLLKQYFRVYGYGMRQKMRKKNKSMLWKARRRHIHDSIVLFHSALPDPFLFTYGNDVCSSLWGWSGWANDVGAYKMFVSYFWKTTHSHPHPHRYLWKSISIMHTSSASSLLYGCCLPGKILSKQIHFF